MSLYIQNVYSNPANVKELIPEFYGEDDSFLSNIMRLNLGNRQNEKRVDVNCFSSFFYWNKVLKIILCNLIFEFKDVKLPPWSKNSTEFLKINRKALESDYVSQNLHNWIDLIFGFKQRGPQSVDADNGNLYFNFGITIIYNFFSFPSPYLWGNGWSWKHHWPCREKGA